MESKPGLPSGIAALCLIGSLLFAGASTLHASSSATRNMPDTFQAGQEVTVTVDVEASDPGWALEETVPEGWEITDPGEGTVQANDRDIRFPPETSDTEKTFTYVVVPPAEATGTATFHGVLTVDITQFEVGGDTVITASADPADPGDPQDPGDPEDPSDPSGDDTATRSLPEFYVPEQEVNVSIEVSTSALGWALEETVPEGWEITDSGEGTVQANDRDIRFPLENSEHEKTFTYVVVPPADATGAASFDGVLTVDIEQFTTSGDVTIDIDPDFEPGPALVEIDPFDMTITAADQAILSASRIYNLSGNYEYSVDVHGGTAEMEYTLSHNSRGRLSGGDGDGDSSFSFDGPEWSFESDDLQVHGTVRRLGSSSNPVHRVNLTVRASGEADIDGENTPVTMVLNKTMELDENNNRLTGSVNARANLPDETLTDEVESQEIALPDGTDGNWTLDIAADGDAWGTATLNVQDDPLSYTVTGFENEDNGRRILNLEAQAAGESTLRVDLDENDNVILMMGTVKGQRLNAR